MARSAPKKRKGVYHRTMVWLGWRRDKDGNLVPDARETPGMGGSKRKAPRAPSKTYDDIRRRLDDDTVAKMIVTRLPMMAGRARAEAPSAADLPAAHDDDPPLKPSSAAKPAR